MNERDPRSDVHYLGSSENKAWKKFRPVRDRDRIIRSSNIWLSYILNRLIINSVDKTRSSCYTPARPPPPHPQRSTTVSLVTYPFIQQ